MSDYYGSDFLFWMLKSCVRVCVCIKSMPLCIQICSLNVICYHRWWFFLAWCNLRLRQNIACIVLSTHGNHFKTVTFIWFFTYFTFTICLQWMFYFFIVFVVLAYTLWNYFTSFTNVLQWYLWRFTLSLYFIPLEPCQNNFDECVFPGVGNLKNE